MDQSALVATIVATHFQQIDILLDFLLRRKRQAKHILRLMRESYIRDITTIYSHRYFLRNPRTLWSKPRRRGWLAHVLKYRDEHDFFESFKMKKKTFQYICDMLRKILEPKLNLRTPRIPIGVEEQVAICVYYLGCCAELRVIGEIFGYAKSTIWKCVRRVCQSIVDILLPIWIKMPNQDECEKLSLLFEIRTGLPQIIGAIDGSHIPISPPKEGGSDFINRKGWPSINLQALVDHDIL